MLAFTLSAVFCSGLSPFPSYPLESTLSLNLDWILEPVLPTAHTTQPAEWFDAGNSGYDTFWSVKRANYSRGFVSSMFWDFLNTLIPDCSFGRSPLILNPGFVAQNQRVITLCNCVAQTQVNLLTLGSWPNNILTVQSMIGDELL